MAAVPAELPTPTLDAESENLLQNVSEQGGYAFVNLAALAAGGDIRAAEAAREMAWEQLHSGPWHSVLPVWRDAYSMSCLRMAVALHRAGDWREALRVLDLGLIMGGNLLRKDLGSAVELIMRSCGDGGCGGGAGEGSLEERREWCSESCDKAEVIRVLPNRSLSCKFVEKRSSLSLEAFLCDYFISGVPVIISDCMADWPASTKWKDPAYLKKIAGDRTVPVEVGKNYLCSNWKQELIPFSQFLERIQSNDCSAAGPTYLAQHPLFDQGCGGGESPFPTGTSPSRARIPQNFSTTQAGSGGNPSAPQGVVGRKYVRLYPASVSEDLYPFTESMLSNSSQVDLDNIYDKEFPKARDLDFMDCILEQGQMLYIPPKWWHYVKSLTTSFSVSFWWNEMAANT
ncbi:hypothetical protein Syun_017377 [Stephania yunnanensis]|uniref:JmjC domain-containing protein n=1 Tax=Stephania yunnanensis TaxID=152371 RepID=A0AAP0J8F2_9MAGN